VFGLRLRKEFVKSRESEFVRIRDDVWWYVRLFGLRDNKVDIWGDLLRFVSDVIVEMKFKNYFKYVKCKFTNLSLLLKYIWIMNYDIFCVGLN